MRTAGEWASRDNDVDPNVVVEAEHRFDVALRALDTWLDAMEAAGLSTPAMPPEWRARMNELAPDEEG